MINKPFFSVIIPATKITPYLTKETLPALNKQTYGNFEVILLINQIDPILKSKFKNYLWLKIIITKNANKPAEKRNLGVKFAKGDILAFIDADAYPGKSWLKKAAQIFVRKDVLSACGPGIIPPHASIMEKVINQIFQRWLGSGGLSYRFTKSKSRYVDDFPSMNFFLKKNVFLQLGGFDIRYWPGEDSKLCNKLINLKKNSILYHPELTVFHHRRKNLRSYLKQQGSYGYHRGLFFAQGDKNSRKLIYISPAFFVIYFVVLIVFFILKTKYLILNTIIIFPFTIYFLGVVYLSIGSLLNAKSVKIAFLLIIILFLTHFVYGTMFIVGYCYHILKLQKQNLSIINGE